MTEENKQQNSVETKSHTGARERRVRPRRRRGRGQREQREFEQKILELARVTRVTKGGKRMSFRTCLVIGDRKGRVGIGVAKGSDVAVSVEKAFRQAKKNLITVQFVNGTVAHEVRMKNGAASVLLKPASKGTGLKSGGAARMVLELCGVPNAVTKILGSNNKINNAKAMVGALAALKTVPEKQKPAKKKEEKGEGKAKKPASKKKDK